ncbi:TRPM8 channel-associated factor homolog [Paramormyrops kingsleyae]|uniref:Si:ch211-210b2.4 n=1 Tax=Paramormyrops kingsleyae TaxID=1676925 RepID=A0A3B3R520_9TELE|nr:TRPM8 channel-associated factor homolog [Paramormyrops kingsleyae]XP_023689295.1 TRPM8 channel-associated factor homolog [Paramormyrops kingsleyae]
MARVKAYNMLMGGITELDFQGKAVPSDLVLIGDEAFPLAMNHVGQVLMAASSYGMGRLVVLGHEEYLTAFPSVVKNVLAWLNTPSKPTVGIHPACTSFAQSLSCPNEVGNFQKKMGIYVTDAYSMAGSEKELVSYLKGGGSLLVAGQAWDWAQKNPGQNALRDFPGNKVCSVAGIYFSEHKGKLGMFPVPKEIPSSWLAVSIGKDFKDDYKFLLDGVSEFDIRGGALPSEILVHGPLAFPIATTGDGRAFFAGAYYGQGRVIVGTHEGYLGRAELSRFLCNAVRWLDEGRNGCVGVHPNLAAAHSLLTQSGLHCELTNFREDLSVYVCKSYSDEHCTRIQGFVAEGKGLLIAGHAWAWAQNHGNHRVMIAYPGNRILNKMGISILGSTVNAGLYKAPKPETACSEVYHFRPMLQRLAGHVMCGEPLKQSEQDSLKHLGQDCSAYLHMKAHNCHSYASILSVLTSVVKQGGVPQVGKNRPIKDPKEHLLLNVSSQLYEALPNPDEIVPHIVKQKNQLPVVSNAKAFINGNTAGHEEWKSTGLYLSPGMRTYISVPSMIVGKGWQLQIGCQTDNLGNAGELRRAPVVHKRFPVNSEMILVSNLWGGLLYLVAPPNSTVGDFEIHAQWAILAPYYKSGKTTVAEWVGGLRAAPAPWAELEFDNIILTMKSKMVQDLDRPDEVAVLWDSIMKGVADLASIPAKLPRKERFVADVQISHGFMHAGYPIMLHGHSVKCLLEPKVARERGIWGAIHELGHNQQRNAWEFPPNTTECTCNLWSIYVHEEVLGVPRAKAHEAVNPNNRKQRLQQFVKEGKQYGKWEMWTALETYIQLQEKFGWEAFKKVFSAYHNMQNVPNDRDGKMNLYAETFSKTVNQNLAPFFKAWGWPISASLEQNLAALPVWSDHPMVNYA